MFTKKIINAIISLTLLLNLNLPVSAENETPVETENNVKTETAIETETTTATAEGYVLFLFTKEELLKAAGDGFFRFDAVRYGKEDAPFVEYLREAGHKVGTTDGILGRGVIELGEIKTSDDAVKAYEYLIELRDDLIEGLGSGLYDEDELFASNIFQHIGDKIEELEDEYTTLQGLIDEANATAVHSAFNKVVNEQGLPETTEEFREFNNAIREAVISSGKFLSSGDFVTYGIEVGQAVDDLLKQYERYDGFYEELERDSEYKGKSFDEIFFNDPERDDDVSDTINGYLEDIEKLDDALEKIKSGNFDDKDFFDLDRLLEADLNQLLAETGSYEKAIERARREIVGLEGWYSESSYDNLFGYVGKMAEDMELTEENIAATVRSILHLYRAYHPHH